jgi:hypothetical protein
MSEVISVSAPRGGLMLSAVAARVFHERYGQLATNSALRIRAEESSGRYARFSDTDRRVHIA